MLDPILVKNKKVEPLVGAFRRSLHDELVIAFQKGSVKPLVTNGSKAVKSNLRFTLFDEDGAHRYIVQHLCPSKVIDKICDSKKVKCAEPAIVAFLALCAEVRYAGRVVVIAVYREYWHLDVVVGILRGLDIGKGGIFMEGRGRG